MTATSNERRQEQQQAFLAAFAKTGIISRASEESGVIHTTHHRWMKDDAAYAARFAELKRETAALAAETRKPPGPAMGTRQSGPRAERQRVNQERFLAALAVTGIVADAVKETGIPQATHNYWTRHYPEYASATEAVLAQTEEVRKAQVAARIGAGSRKAWDDPGRREAWSEHQRSSWTPEMREAAGQRNADRMADPEYRDRWLAESRKSREFAACDNPTYFDEIDTPEKAYWLGFIATDGCVRGFESGSLRLVIKLARKDRAHLEILHHALQAKRPIRDTEEWSKPPGTDERKKRPASVLDVCSPQIVNALVRHGITARKTDELQPWDGPAHLMRHYWRGVIDGDGTIGTYDGEAKLGLCGSKPLVEAFLEWAKGICGTTANPRQGKQGNRRYWLLALGGNQRLPKLIFALYADAPVALARKKAEALLILTGKPLADSPF
jgi:hypothetical protein